MRLICLTVPVMGLFGSHLLAANLPTGNYQTKFGEVELKCDPKGFCKGSIGAAPGSPKAKLRFYGNISSSRKLTGYWFNISTKHNCFPPSIDTDTGHYGKIAFHFNADFSTWKGHWSYCDATPTPGAKEVGKWDGQGKVDDPTGLKVFLEDAARIDNVPNSFIMPILGRLKVSFGTTKKGETARYTLSKNTIHLNASLGEEGRLKPYDKIPAAAKGSIHHELMHGYIDWIFDTGGEPAIKEKLEWFKTRHKIAYPQPNNPKTDPCKTPTELSDRQTYQLVQENWGATMNIVASDFIMFWRQFDNKAMFYEEFIKTFNSKLKQGKFAGYYYDGWGDFVFVSKYSSARRPEIDFILRKVLKIDNDIVDRIVKRTFAPACPITSQDDAGTSSNMLPSSGQPGTADDINSILKGGSSGVSTQ